MEARETRKQHTALMGEEDGLAWCGKRTRQTAAETQRLSGPASQLQAPAASGPRPRPAFSTTLYEGGGSASEKVLRPQGPRGVGLPKRQRPCSVCTPTGSRPEVCHRLPDPPSALARPRGAPAPRPKCLPHFQGFGADRVPLLASGSGQTRPSGPLTPRTQCSPQRSRSGCECAVPSLPAPNRPGPARGALGAGSARLQPQMASGPRAGQLGGRRQAPRPSLPGPVSSPGDGRKGS